MRTDCEGTWIYPSRESTEGFRPWSHTPDMLTTVLMKTWNTRELLSPLREQGDPFHAEGLRGVICRHTHALGKGKGRATEDQGRNDLSNARVTPVPEPPTAPHCTEKITHTPHCQLPRLWPLLSSSTALCLAPGPSFCFLKHAEHVPFPDHCTRQSLTRTLFAARFAHPSGLGANITSSEGLS